MPLSKLELAIERSRTQGPLWVKSCNHISVLRLRDHYSDVIMGAMASEITSLPIVYFTVYSDADQRTIKLRVTGLCAGNSTVTGEFPAQKASNAENVYIWWHHHMKRIWLEPIYMVCHHRHAPKYFNHFLDEIIKPTVMTYFASIYVWD